MKKKIIKLIVKILKYLIPAILGWLEGDSHAVVDSLLSILALF